ncbi:TPA: transposase [Salmonella enterica subsp. enterica serovar Eastbourne]
MLLLCIARLYPQQLFLPELMSKACNSCGFNPTEQWVSQQSHILPDGNWQHITFTIPHLLWSFFNSNWPLLNALFCALHTYGRQLNQHPHIHLSVTSGGLDVKHGV